MNLSADSQIAAFLNGQPYLALTEDAHTPQVIFRGALELDREQEQALVDHIDAEMRALKQRIGAETTRRKLRQALWPDYMHGPTYGEQILLFLGLRPAAFGFRQRKRRVVWYRMDTWRNYFFNMALDG